MYNKFGKNINTIYLMLTDQCPCDCSYCVSGDTLITMSDLTKKKISDIKVGDTLLSVEEYPSKSGYKRKMINTTVLKTTTPRLVDEIYKLTTDKGEVLNITGQHPILISRNKWVTIDSLYKRKEREIYRTTLPTFKEKELSNDYKLGYLIGCWLGDGSFKFYKKSNKYNADTYACRFVVKDEEILGRMLEYMDLFNIYFYTSDFKISTKYNIITKAIMSRKKETFDSITNLVATNFGKNDNSDYLLGFLAGIYDCEGSFSSNGNLRICNTDELINNEIVKGFEHLNIAFSRSERKGKNKILSIFTLKEKSINKFLENVLPACERKRVNIKYKSNQEIVNISSLEKEYFGDYVYNLETTSGTYIANNLIVHNCYIKDRDSHSEISIDIIEKSMDLLSTDKPRIIFFGGEPLLKLDLMRETIKKYPKAQFQVVTSAVVNLKEFLHDIYLPNESHFDLQISWDGETSSTRKLKNGEIVNVLDTIKYVASLHPLQVRCVLNDINVQGMFDAFKAINDLYIETNNICIDFTIAHQETMENSFVEYFSEQSIKILEYCSDNKSIIPQLLVNQLLNITNKHQSTSCDAGNYLVIRPNGDIYPCTILSQYGYDFCIGNVLEQDKKFKYNIIDEIKNESTNEKCISCVYNLFCDGGCRYERYLKNKKDYLGVICDHQCNNMKLFMYLSDWFEALPLSKQIKYINRLSSNFINMSNYYSHLQNKLRRN